LDERVGRAKERRDEMAARGFDDASEQAICLDCVRDDALRDEVRPYLAERACTFCGAESEDEGAPIAAGFGDFMSVIMRAITFRYRTVGDAGLYHDEGQWVGGDVLDAGEAAADVCGDHVTVDVLEAIGSAIREPLWTDASLFEARPDQVLTWSWQDFRDKVKYESRFVFLSGDRTGEGLDEHRCGYSAGEILGKLEQIITDNDIVRTAPAGTGFWRGRLADDPGKVKDYASAQALGSPPCERASNNRMSPAGISMFYGSENIDTAVAEIGAHSIKRHAVVGEFETVRKLALLDLANLPALPSLYQQAGREHYDDLRFLHFLARDLAKPISLDGQEHIEYVPTQVVTEYLRYLPHCAVDGILFRSAQNHGVNCVLFCGPEGCLEPDASEHSGTVRAHKPAFIRLKPDTIAPVGIVATVKQS
jgi:hypothetical protein